MARSRRHSRRRPRQAKSTEPHRRNTYDRRQRHIVRRAGCRTVAHARIRRRPTCRSSTSTLLATRRPSTAHRNGRRRRLLPVDLDRSAGAHIPPVRTWTCDDRAGRAAGQILDMPEDCGGKWIPAIERAESSDRYALGHPAIQQSEPAETAPLTLNTKDVAAEAMRRNPDRSTEWAHRPLPHPSAPTTARPHSLCAPARRRTDQCAPGPPSGRLRAADPETR